ncbi:cation-transporting P-type ATPase [Candidatus Woesearchaeota archaeon]|nr:cation-transporting P-type ATPase [Candidatus Woesearchaeota archaeon]
MDSYLSKKDYSNSHKIPLKSLIKIMNSGEGGLKTADVKERLKKYGKNQLTEKKDKPLILKFLLQFNNFFSYLLLFGALLSIISEIIVPGQGSEYIAIALFGVTILNAAFTFVQEYKAEKAMRSFKNLMTSQVVVLRDGKKNQINSVDVVPGDIVLLSEGDKISIDGRIIEQSNLKVDHSALTGESEPQLRSTKPTSKKLILSRNMVFSGTLVQGGTGKVLVVATGDHTQIGIIAKVTNEVQTQVSHLQKQIGSFIKVISYIAVFLGITFCLMGIFITKNPFWINLVFGIGIIVANVPEGLLPTVTLTLSIAAQKMAKQKVLIKNIDAIETLGSLTVVCSDKTGTLTENDLFTDSFYINDAAYSFDRQKKRIQCNGKTISEDSIKGMQDFNDILVLCNNSSIRDGKRFGDSTEICLKNFVSVFRKIELIEKKNPREHEIPFSSETKYMITVNRVDKHSRAHMKGAPEIVIDKCDKIFHEGKICKLTPKIRNKWLSRNTELANKGYRVLGCALKELDSKKQSTIEKNDYCFYGLVAMQDPPRPEVPSAVALCHKAGLKIIVISGDQGTTVANIARQVGIIQDNPKIINGEDLEKYDDEELMEVLKSPELIFSRSLPKDKMRIVSLLQQMGEIVAVTGDGVNDAPALRKANVGIAMGKSGTEVAKEAADVVLLDDNFASIVNAIKSGRTVYDNIKNFITYILTSNTPEIVPFLLFILLGWPLALPVLLILAIDLGTDMLPAIGLGVEKSSKDIMTRKPRDPKSKLLNWKMIARSYGFIGPMQTAFAYVIFFNILLSNGWNIGDAISITNPVYMMAVTGFFSTVVITQIFNVFACRTTRSSVFSKGIFSNKLIIFGIFTEILLLVVISTIPIIQTIFGTHPFPLYYVSWMIGFGIIILLFEELRKAIFRKWGCLGIED